ncbi:MAG TPA: isoaspartyl peptidase/L-asparaginase, partial [Gemmatimonadales bacterium]|nr:isoaspartyl peptidase/L-asparaginase [Gemmatimonadales bacterium]
SRRKWLTWRANHEAQDVSQEAWEDGTVASRAPGIVYLSVVNSAGDIASATSTSGPAWKAPGRAGTWPVAGALQYVDNDVGAAGSSGFGEPGMMDCGGFITVENMRQGMRPTDAALETLRRIVAKVPARFLMGSGLPRFSLTFYAVNKRGEFGAASLYPGRYAAHDGRRGAERDTAYLYDRAL